MTLTRMNQIDKVVEINNASIFRGSREVLTQINYSLIRGEFCYITGKTGSGKSSFVKSLYGSCQIQGDKVEVLGQDLLQLSSELLPFYRRKLGIIFQEFRLFDDWTVYENLDFVLRATDWEDSIRRKERIGTVMDQIGLTDKMYMNVFELSGGEQQGVAIGRAILNKPRLILADEPMGNLDDENTEKLIVLLHDLALEYQASVVLSTHNQKILNQFPSRQFVCENNGIHEI